MSTYSLSYEKTFIGKGMYALYCWRSDCLCPAGIVLFIECGDGGKGNEGESHVARTRADIIHIYVVEWSRGQGIGKEMIHKLQEDYDVIHTPVAESKESEVLLKNCGFVHNNDAIDWCWNRPQKKKIVANANTNKALAVLLGWRDITIRDIPQEKGEPIKIYVGLPPANYTGIPAANGEARPIPSWSQDMALALGLLVDLGERSKLDYQWWKMGDTYCCGIREAGETNASYKNEDVSPWYNSFPLAICHALIVYLQRHKEWQQVHEDNGSPAKMTPELAKECAKASAHQFDPPPANPLATFDLPAQQTTH